MRKIYASSLARAGSMRWPGMPKSEKECFQRRKRDHAVVYNIAIGFANPMAIIYGDSSTGNIPFNQTKSCHIFALCLVIKLELKI